MVPRRASEPERRAGYAELLARLDALLDGETDDVARQATAACELAHAFEGFDWVGFYRVIAPSLLAIGPYQGGHGCLRIAFERGVCGLAAREERVVVVPDVAAFPDHIACSSTTKSEIVVPVFDAGGALVAVLDVDSDDPDAFSDVDVDGLVAVAVRVGRGVGSGG
jgi:L-methionine (R)-S-oxide reductase